MAIYSHARWPSQKEALLEPAYWTVRPLDVASRQATLAALLSAALDYMIEVLTGVQARYLLHLSTWLPVGFFG